MSDVDTIFDAVSTVRKHTQKEEPIAKEPKSRHKLINSGCTLLNLACSDNPFGAFPIGTMVHLVGDSSSGKTMLAMTVFAELSKREEFSRYKFIYDDVEAANAFDMPKLFGTKAARRIEAPNGEESSGCIEDFQANILRLIRKERPFIYILDSFDALTSDMEEKKADVAAKARDEGKESKGSYGMEKAKIGGQILRMICRKLKKTSSLLIIISQVRDNTDPMSMVKRSVSGGRALKFYASHQIWLMLGNKIKSKDRVTGVVSIAKVAKNKITGKVRDVEFQIFYDYGVDDIGACVDFLVNEKVWRKKGNKIIARGAISFIGMRGKLIRYIEKEGLERVLKTEVGKAWNEIEDSLKLNRKPKYD